MVCLDRSVHATFHGCCWWGGGKLRSAFLDGGKGQGIEIGAKLWER